MTQKILTGILDTDFYLLRFLDDRSLINFSQTCRYAWTLYEKKELWLCLIRYNLPHDYVKYFDDYISIKKFYFDCRKLEMLDKIDDKIVCAAKLGNLPLVKYCCDKGAFYRNIPMKEAGEAGHLEIVKWLSENGGVYWQWTLNAAIKNVQWDVIRYCLINGSYDLEKSLQLSIETEDDELIRYFQSLMEITGGRPLRTI